MLNDIKKVGNLLTKEKSKAAATKAKPGKKDVSKNVGLQHVIFEQVGDLCSKIAHVEEDKIKDMALDAPCVVRFDNEKLPTLWPPEAKLAVGQLKKLFKQQGSTSRAEVGLDLSIIQAIGKDLQGMLPESAKLYMGFVAAVATDSKALSLLLHKNLVTTAFVVAPNYATFAVEKNFLPCLRMASEGVRMVVLLPYEKVAAFLGGIGGAQQATSDFVDAKTKQSVTQFLKFCSAEKLKELIEVQACPCFAGSVHPTEALYVPAGWVFAELTKADVSLGIKMPLLVNSKAATSFFERVQTSGADAMSDLGQLAAGYLQVIKKENERAQAEPSKEERPEEAAAK